MTINGTPSRAISTACVSKPMRCQGAAHSAKPLSDAARCTWYVPRPIGRPSNSINTEAPAIVRPLRRVARVVMLMLGLGVVASGVSIVFEAVHVNLLGRLDRG